jgi:O-antigen/teichoic acid export membrane protein
MMHKRTILINAAANWAGFVSQVVVTLVAAPILIHGLGDDRYGLWALVESILAYLSLFDLGIAASLVRYVARFEAESDQKSLNRMFNTSLALFAGAGLAVMAVVSALAVGWSNPLGAPEQFAWEVRILLLLLGANLAAGLPLGVFPTVLDGLGRYPVKTIIRTSCLLVRTVVVISVVRSGHGLIALAIVSLVFTAVENGAHAYAVRRYLPGLRISLAWVDRSTFRLIRGYSAYSFLAMIAGRVSFQTDAIVIGAFLAPKAITFFVIGARLVDYTKSLFRSITTVLTPAVSALDARGHVEAIRDILVDGTRYVLWIVVPIELGLLLLGKPFLALWLGPEYANLSTLSLQILSIPMALVVAQFVAARILYGVDRVRQFALTVTVEAGVNLALSLLLVRRMGIEGVALGTALPNLLSTVIVVYLTLRYLGLPAGRYIRRVWIGPLCCAVPLGLFWAAITTLGAPMTLLGFLAAGLVGVGGYAILAAGWEFGPARIYAEVSNVLSPPELTRREGR